VDFAGCAIRAVQKNDGIATGLRPRNDVDDFGFIFIIENPSMVVKGGEMW
jgi:hypothetical protein